MTGLIVGNFEKEPLQDWRISLGVMIGVKMARTHFYS